MNEKEKAACVTGTHANGGVDHCQAVGNTPQSHCSTQDAASQGRIAAILPRGAENAVSARLLMQMIGIPNRKQLRVMVDYERQAGALILSKMNEGGGYFLPDYGIKGMREIEAFIKTFRAQAGNTFRMLKPFRDAVKDWKEGE